MSMEHFAKDTQSRLLALNKQLSEGSYKPMPVRRVYIPKAGSKEQRPLGIPCVKDRVVQTALKMVLEPIFEQEFSDHSYGFRSGRSCTKWKNCYFKQLGLCFLADSRAEYISLRKGALH